MERGGAVRVLVVDDSPHIREALGAILSRQPGLAVAGEAADGERGIAEAARLQPDVVLLGLTMPVVDGLSALPEIRRVAPQARVLIYSSAVPTDALLRQLTDAGADDYLSKATRSDELVRVIRETALRVA